MNEETRYVMGIYQAALVIGDTLEYAIPASSTANGEKISFDVDAYETRKKLLEHLLEPNAPLMLFCANNGETGEKIKTQLKEFASEVYGIGEETGSGTIVSVGFDAEGKKEVRVETSLVIHLLDQIIGLHETLTDIMNGFMNNFKEKGNLEEGLKELVMADDAYYRSQAMFVISTNICTYFIDYNNAVRSVINQKKAEGVDVSSDPNFKVESDPSVYFINQELSKLFNFGNFVKAHNRTIDAEFSALMDSYSDKIHYFNGTKKLNQGQNMYQAMGEFQEVFRQSIASRGEAWRNVYNREYTALVEFEKNQQNATSESAEESK